MIPTQRQIDLMDPRDRAQLPRKIRLTTSERRTADEHREELKMHDEFCSYLRLRKRIFAYVHANPSRRSTIQSGWPDFSVFCRVMLGPRPKVSACLIEFKAVGGRLSPAQIQRFEELSRAGIEVFVCTTLGDAIMQLKEYFELPMEALVNE